MAHTTCVTHWFAVATLRTQILASRPVLRCGAKGAEGWAALKLHARKRTRSNEAVFMRRPIFAPRCTRQRCKLYHSRTALPSVVQSAYQILGVDPSCSNGELKAAWRQLAMRWHPDRSSEVDRAKCEDMFRRGHDAFKLIQSLRLRGSSHQTSFAESSTNYAAHSARPDGASWQETRGHDFGQKWREHIKNTHRNRHVCG